MGGAQFWLKLFGGAAVLFALTFSLAHALGSVRGEWGLAVGACVLAATIALDRFLFGRSWRASVRCLGLGAAQSAGLLAAFLIGAVLVTFLVVAAVMIEAPLTFRPGWLLLVPGLLAQAGLAEELVFRGFVYGRLRQTRPFWRAVALSLPPFALVHVAMFATLPWPIALASLALSVIMTPALCRLYDLGGRTIWGPAIVHAVAQGAIKVLDIGGDGANGLPLIWIAGCAAAPYLAFAFRPALKEKAPADFSTGANR